MVIHTFSGIMVTAFGIFHWWGVVVVVLDGREICGGYLWHVIDDVWAVVVAGTVIGSMTFH